MKEKQLKYKELDAIIKAEHLPWKVDDQRLPDDLIHLNAMGSVPPKGLKPASKTKSSDLKALITEKTGNPFLCERRKALGYITGKAHEIKILKTGQHLIYRPDPAGGKVAGGTQRRFGMTKI